jgi:hypothetical protein
MERFYWFDTLCALSLMACSASPIPLSTDAFADVVSAPSGGDASDSADPTPCPTSGSGGVLAPDTECLLVTPAQTGASTTGQNATVTSYALAPNAGGSGKLVLFFNSSDSHPAAMVASPTQSFYTAATSLGHSVIAISYASQQIIGALCATDACFAATRETIIAGEFKSGASATLEGIQLDEGIVWRVAALLRWLAANDSSHGWSTFLVPSSSSLPPDQQIAWSRIISVGHSQGGGHAAMVGKLYSVLRVAQLSSTCDALDGTPVTWTSASNGSWMTNPNGFYGLAAPTTFTGDKPTGGDTTCPYHTAVWTNLGMIVARSNNAAATCGMTGDTHGASIGCADNFAAWQFLLE